MGPLPSIGFPRASTTRPSISIPTGTSTYKFNEHPPIICDLGRLTISPVRLTVSPSLTKRSEPKSTTPTCPASKFMHMPLTPEANLLLLAPEPLLIYIVQLTRQALRLGHCSYHGHERYRHYKPCKSALDSPFQPNYCVFVA